MLVKPLLEQSEAEATAETEADEESRRDARPRERERDAGKIAGSETQRESLQRETLWTRNESKIMKLVPSALL